jgi:hypothetical protein
LLKIKPSLPFDKVGRADSLERELPGMEQEASNTPAGAAVSTGKLIRREIGLRVCSVCDQIPLFMLSDDLSEHHHLLTSATWLIYPILILFRQYIDQTNQGSSS